MIRTYADVRREFEAMEKARREERKVIWKDTFNAIGAAAKGMKRGVCAIASPVTAIARGGFNYLGKGGVAGAIGGYLITGGPIGIFVGAIAGKNFKLIKESMINFFEATVDSHRKARRYERLDAGAVFEKKRYEPIFSVQRPGDDSGKIQKTGYFIKKGLAELANFGARGYTGAHNLLGRTIRMIENAENYRALERIAEEYSARTGNYITPERIYRLQGDL